MCDKSKINMMSNSFKILELYSGIGGMHSALKDSGIPAEVIAAVDINTLANEVYKHNFPNTQVLNRSIESLSINELDSYKFDTILMSPPCQPFTRNGNQLDLNDPRTKSFLHMLKILKKLSVKNILMENVKGFEISECRNLFLEVLVESGFEYQEYLLSPKQIGFPNSRLRYYCLAKQTGNSLQREIQYDFPQNSKEPDRIANYLEKDVPETYQLSDYFLKKIKCLDIVFENSTNSCCFTKAYTHYADGTGSIFCPDKRCISENIISNIKTANIIQDKLIEDLKTLKLRFFTPNEVLSLMGFPKSFSFPASVTKKQKYRLLGNSINVKVVSELIKTLLL